MHRLHVLATVFRSISHLQERLLLVRFLDRFRPKPKKGRPKGSKTKHRAHEKAEIELQEAMTELKLEEIRAKTKRIQGGHADKSLSVAELADLNRQLKPLGLHIIPIDGDNPAEDGTFARILNSQAGAAFAAVLAQTAGPSIAQMFMAKMPVDATSQPPPLPPPSELPQLTGGPNVQLASMLLIHTLKDKSPFEAAGWFLSQKTPELQQLIPVLCEAKDEDIPGFIPQIAGFRADLGDFAGWLAQRPDWFVQTVQQIRTLTTPQ